jgi:hypothetical protein
MGPFSLSPLQPRLSQPVNYLPDELRVKPFGQEFFTGWREVLFLG